MIPTDSLSPSLPNSSKRFLIYSTLLGTLINVVSKYWKLARLAEGANGVFHQLSHLYLSIAYTLSKNKRLLTESSAEFCDIILAIQANAFVSPCKDLTQHTSFAMKRVAKLTHHASCQYDIYKTMHYKIEFFCNKLKPDSGIKWETPIAHLIP